MLVIGMTGLARSGKGAVAEYLKKKGFAHFDFYTDVLVEELKKRNLEPTRESASVVGDEMRDAEGMAVMAKRLLARLQDSPHEKVVITGFRSPEEVDYIRNESEEFYLLELRASPDARYNRRDERKQAKEEFFARDDRDIENKGLRKVMDLADYSIDNNADLQSLYRKVDDFLKKVDSGELA
jgi:dephospho-CoA kinase